MRAIAFSIVFAALMLGYKLDLLFAPKKYSYDEKKLLGGTICACLLIALALIGFGL